MKRIIIICLGIGIAATPVVAADNEALLKDSRTTIKLFASNLKSKLQSAMKLGGPVKAIQVCNTEAPAIAKDLSKKYNGNVARTSLKFRNSANKPDDWEKKVLQKFEQQKSSGTPVKQLEYSEKIEVNGKQVFRYMKAIPTGAVCLKCHGTNIKSTVHTKINTLYPDDLATGFNQGDIRGAFTLMKEFN